jgi:N-acetylneuraminate synthase
MLIGNRKIGPDNPPLIIAEIGINHGGNLSTAKQMVDAAFAAGAEVIKHQTHIIDDEMSLEAKKVIPGNSNKSIYSIMEEASLDEESEYELMQYTIQKGMIFISTPFSRAAADRLNKFNIPAFKIGSGECNNLPLIKHICEFGKPIILSTGMNDINSVSESVEIIESYNIPYALLHTTNLYPTPYHLVRLGGMLKLKEKFPNALIGLSDHTINNNASLAAIALGANIIERHFTDSKHRIGPDIINSMDPNELKELVKSSKEIFLMLGGEKEPANEEKVTMDFAFSTVVAIKDIQKGERLNMTNIWVKRPGTGEIKAREFESLLGKKTKKLINSGQHLKWEEIE